MKKVIKLALVLMCAMISTSLYAQKFARINLQEVIFSMPEFTQMQTDLQKNRANLNESVRNLKEKELQDLQQRYMDFQQIAQQDVDKKQNELFEPIHVKAAEAVKKVAAAGGYTAVFDTSVNSLAYFNESTVVDIAPAVRAELGIKDAPAAK